MPFDPGQVQYLRKGIPNIGGRPCPDVWVGKGLDGSIVTYRPAGFAGPNVAATSATVSVNSELTRQQNVDSSGKPRELKLIFPQTGAGA